MRSALVSDWLTRRESCSPELGPLVCIGSRNRAIQRQDSPKTRMFLRTSLGWSIQGER
jgi:hypothetical protein